MFASFLHWEFLSEKVAVFLIFFSLILSVVSPASKFLVRHVYISWLDSEAFDLAHILRFKFFNGRPICVFTIVVETNK